MTKNRFKTLSEMVDEIRETPSKYDPEFAKLVDECIIGLSMASIAIKLPPEDQMLFRFQAVNFSPQQFAITVNWWNRLSEERRVVMRQILTDIGDAFDEWDAWTGNKATVEEQEDFREMVKTAQARVLSHIAKLKVVLPRKDE